MVKTHMPPSKSSSRPVKKKLNGKSRTAKATGDVSDASPGLRRRDGWQSALTGIGSEVYDKRQFTFFNVEQVSIQQATELWRGDDIAARIIETVPNEMLRQGYDVVIEGDDKAEQEELVARHEELEVSQRLWEALCGERAWGGSAVMLGVVDGQEDLSQPLRWETVRSFDWLTTLEPTEVSPVYYYTDPRSPQFGQAAVYQLNPMAPGPARAEGNRVPDPIPPMTYIHESRLLVFDGIRVSRRQMGAASGGWGDSVLTRVWPTLRDFNDCYSAAGVLVQDFAQAVFKIKGLAELLALNSDEVVKTRMRAVNLSRSTARAILLDAEEEFDRKQTPVSGLPELLDRFQTRLAAAADMPLTLLMGMSPGGLNATGASDIRFFYDRVRAKQEQKLRPALEKITRLIMLANGGEPENWSIQFKPLWQPTEAEQVQSRQAQATIDNTYIAAGVLTPEEVAKNRFAGDTYSFDTKIDFEAREMLRLEEEREPPEAPSGTEGEVPEEDPQVPLPGKVLPFGRSDAVRMDYIRKRKGKWVVLSEDGKVLGTHKTRTAAERQLRAIEASKHRRDEFNPDQPRDETGKWASGGGSAGGQSVGSGRGPSFGENPEAYREHRKSSGHYVTPDTEQEHFKDGKWDKSRQRLHQHYTEKKTVGLPTTPEPTVYMTGGGPASGKSTAILNNPSAKIPGADRAAHVDPDGAKLEIPEYTAGVESGDESAASAVHEESSHMAKVALRAAISGGHDTVYDSVGDSGIDKLEKKVNEMRASGAKRVVAAYVTVDIDEAVRRANARAAKTGRVVKEKYIREAHSDVSRTTVAAIERGTFDELKLYNNDGTVPTLVAEYTRETGLFVHDEAAWEAHKARGRQG